MARIGQLKQTPDHLSLNNDQGYKLPYLCNQINYILGPWLGCARVVTCITYITHHLDLPPLDGIIYTLFLELIIQLGYTIIFYIVI